MWNHFLSITLLSFTENDLVDTHIQSEFNKKKRKEGVAI